MTTDEATQVARIALTADGGCSDCAGRLISMLILEFPEHKQAFVDVWRKEWPQYGLYSADNESLWAPDDEPAA